MTDQTWYFYIVKCRDGSLYSGISNDVEGRIEKHNSGAGARYTSGRRPVVLVYSEECGGVSEARRREAQVKKWPKQKKKRLVVGSLPRMDRRGDPTVAPTPFAPDTGSRDQTKKPR